MSELEVTSSQAIAVLEFDEDQKANVAAALQALADKMTPASIKMQPTDEIIELLSDSEASDENDSDCEIMGFISKNDDDSSELREFDMSMIKPMLKQEIKEEVNAPEQESQVLDAATNINTSTGEAHPPPIWKETSFINGLNVNNDDETVIIPDDDSSTSETRDVTGPQMKTEIVRLPQNSVAGGMESLVESVVIIPNTLQPGKAVNLPTYVTLTDITKDELQVEEINIHAAPPSSQVIAAHPTPDIDSEETLSAISEDVSTSFKKEPNVFPSDHLEIGEGSDQKFIVDLLDDDDDDPDYHYSSDEESDNDEETNKIVIDLLESDDENEVRYTESYHKSCRDGFASLIHYICPQCGENCGNFAKFKAHTEGEHQMGTVAALNMRTIIDKVGQLCYQCIECNKKISLRTQYVKLQAHRILHMPHNDYFKCRLCDKRFNYKTSIRAHLKNTHSKITRQYIRKKGPNPCLKFIKIRCPICRRVQSNRVKWWKHLEEAHDYQEKMRSQTTELGDGIYSCNLCKEDNRELKLRKVSIRDHILSHESHKSFKCTGCDAFTSSVLVRAFTHVRREHLQTKGEKKRYLCAYCDEDFASTRQRYSHYRDVHNFTLQKCAVCEREFFSTSLLVSHMNFNRHYKLK